MYLFNKIKYTLKASNIGFIFILFFNNILLDQSSTWVLTVEMSLFFSEVYHSGRLQLHYIVAVGP
jgi:hypothetical protein